MYKCICKVPLTHIDYDDPNILLQFEVGKLYYYMLDENGYNVFSKNNKNLTVFYCFATEKEMSKYFNLIESDNNTVGYLLTRKLGLQVFTKPLSSNTQVVSADELEEILKAGELQSTKTRSSIEETITLKLKSTPLTLEEKILNILSDSTKNTTAVLEEIKDLIQGDK